MLGTQYNPPNWQEKCHLYTTYSPCLLGGYISLIPPIKGTRKQLFDIWTDLSHRSVQQIWLDLFGVDRWSFYYAWIHSLNNLRIERTIISFLGLPSIWREVYNQTYIICKSVGLCGRKPRHPRQSHVYVNEKLCHTILQLFTKNSNYFDVLGAYVINSRPNLTWNFPQRAMPSYTFRKVLKLDHLL